MSQTSTQPSFVLFTQDIHNRTRMKLRDLRGSNTKKFKDLSTENSKAKLSPLYPGKLLVDSKQSFFDKAIQRELYKKYFQKFKKIVTDELPRQVILQILKIVFTKVLNLSDALKLAELSNTPIYHLLPQNTSLLEILEDGSIAADVPLPTPPLKLSAIMFPYVAKDKKKGASWDLWDLEFIEYPRTPISKSMVESILALIEDDVIEMKSFQVDSYLRPARPFTKSSENFVHVLDSLVSVSKEVIIEPLDYVPLEGSWPFAITYLKIDKVSSIEGLENLHCLKEITLDTSVLFSKFTVKIIDGILNKQNALKKLNVEYNYLTTTKDMGNLRECSVDLSHTFREFGFMSVKDGKGIEFELSFSAVDDMNQQCLAMMKSPRCLQFLAPLYGYFVKLQLPLADSAILQLPSFRNLSELVVTPLSKSTSKGVPEFNSACPFRSNSVTGLKVLGNTNAETYDFLNLKYLNNLRYLTIESFQFSYDLFTNLPETETFQEICLDRCKVYGLGKFSIPTSLKSLKLWSTVLELTSTEYQDAHKSPKLKLGISWKLSDTWHDEDDFDFNAGYDELQEMLIPITKLYDVVSTVTFEPMDARPNHVKLTCVPPSEEEVKQRSDMLSYVLQFSEDVSLMAKTEFYDKTCFLNLAADDRPDYICYRGVCRSIMLCFESKLVLNNEQQKWLNRVKDEREVVFDETWSHTFDNKLKDCLKKNKDLDWDFGVVESKRPFNPLINQASL
ncbi:unnamed protein product [Ambrosiozyma monospora]|uniref:Unnamed protein product n=1 Tax=Ambrosiozyma monospora TaxID=43982 RepID=A0A9W6YS32_AMBMO|nr:unnamed protein product [Ambrosiozyma monospora]